MSSGDSPGQAQLTFPGRGRDGAPDAGVPLGGLTYSSAGHPPGIVVPPDNQFILLEGVRSLPLAIRPDAGRTEASYVLPPRSSRADRRPGRILCSALVRVNAASAAWSACGTSSGQDHSTFPPFPPLSCDRYPAVGHPLRDLPAHRGVPARQPQRGPDRALQPGPSRSARIPSRWPSAPAAFTREYRHRRRLSRTTMREPGPESASGHGVWPPLARDCT
jgi:hypothetical protein